jgi:hypothetical protein
MDSLSRTLSLVTAGGVAGAVTHRALQRTDHPAAMSAMCLVGAAVTYRLSDLGAESGPERNRELAAVAATVAAGLASALLPPRVGRQLLAAGWASHAVFDALHHRNSGSNLPDWYPAVCAGFDAAVAAQLVRNASAG